MHEAVRLESSPGVLLVLVVALENVRSADHEPAEVDGRSVMLCRHAEDELTYSPLGLGWSFEVYCGDLDGNESAVGLPEQLCHARTHAHIGDIDEFDLDTRQRDTAGTGRVGVETDAEIGRRRVSIGSRRLLQTGAATYLLDVVPTVSVIPNCEVQKQSTSAKWSCVRVGWCY
jgi:hypothetical protein